MEYRNIITNKFEVIATIRESIKNKNVLLLRTGNTSIHTKFVSVDTDQFCIPANRFVRYANENFLFNIHGSIAKYEFVGSRVTHPLLSSGPLLYFHLPMRIFVLQRRKHERMTTEHINNNYCQFMTNDGVQHMLTVKNISRDGCALICTQDLLFSMIGKKLKSCRFHFPGVEDFILDLKILNVTNISNQLLSTQSNICQLSCSFIITSNKEEKKLLSLIYKLQNSLRNTLLRAVRINNQ